MNISLTFDVEEDLHTRGIENLKFGIPRLLDILKVYNIKATFFAPALLIQKFPRYFLDLQKQGHEIGIHGYEHERFDDLSDKEKNFRIKKSIEIYKKIFKKIPPGFRAPQLSIESKTLDLLDRHDFIYDSSYTPFNILQLIFFPQKIKIWINGFFTPRKIYKINNKLYEIPISSFLIPFSALPLRLSNSFFLKIYLRLIIWANKDVIFFAHSWDFIPIPESRIDRMFNSEKFIKNLEKTIKILSKKGRFLTLEKLAYEKSEKN